MSDEPRMTAPTPERARALLELVETFLLKPTRRRNSRARDTHETPEEMRAWRKALKGPSNGR